VGLVKIGLPGAIKPMMGIDLLGPPTQIILGPIEHRRSPTSEQLTRLGYPNISFLKKSTRSVSPLVPGLNRSTVK
jgi:hypothetical protein